MPFLTPCSCSEVVLCGITIFKGGTLGAELESELFGRSSSPSESAGAGVVVLELVIGPVDGFGLFAADVGLFLSVLVAPTGVPDAAAVADGVAGAVDDAAVLRS